MSDWEIYKKPQKVVRNKKYISITTSKTFGLPRPFIDEYQVSAEDKAVILFNANSGEIAIRFSKTNPDFGYKVRFGKNTSHGAMIIAKHFFDDKNIDASKYSGHYDNYRITKMQDLGLNIEGVAYVFKLQERKKSNQTVSSVDSHMAQENI